MDVQMIVVSGPLTYSCDGSVVEQDRLDVRVRAEKIHEAFSFLAIIYSIEDRYRKVSAISSYGPYVGTPSIGVGVVRIHMAAVGKAHIADA